MSPPASQTREMKRRSNLQSEQRRVQVVRPVVSDIIRW